jgi:hypothetical protein
VEGYVFVRQDAGDGVGVGRYEEWRESACTEDWVEVSEGVDEFVGVKRNEIIDGLGDNWVGFEKLIWVEWWQFKGKIANGSRYLIATQNCAFYVILMV